MRHFMRLQTAFSKFGKACTSAWIAPDCGEDGGIGRFLRTSTFSGMES